MKRHKAAALVLVGWYLMLPPMVRVNGQWTALTKAPLAYWDNVYSADDIADCHEFMHVVKDGLAKKRKMSEQLPSPTLKADRTYLTKLQAMWSGSQCIASDDPRLAK